MKAQEVTLENAMEMAMKHMRLGNYRVGALILQDIIKSVPEHYQGHYYLGIAKYHMGDINAALASVEQALKGDEADAEWWCNYGIMLNDLKRYDDAVTAYDRAIEKEPAYVNSFWNKSHTLWLAERYPEAEAAARIAVEKDPSCAEAWLNLGTALIKLDRREDAKEAWEKALELRPDFAFAWNNLGNLLRDMGQLEAAEEKCRKALEYTPDYPQALNNLANVLMDRGNLKEAEEFYRKAVALKPDYVEAHNNLALVMIGQHRNDEAIVHARYAVSFDPGYVNGLINLSAAQRNLGQLEEAEKTIQKAVILSPDSAEVHIDLADILMMRDRYGDAEIELQKARELKPDAPRVYLKLSNVLERGNKSEEALEILDKAIELNPEMPEAYVRKAGIYHITNNSAKAKEFFLKGLEMNPNMPGALVALAETYQATNEIEKSQETLEKAKAVAPNLPSVYFSLGKIRKYKEGDADFQKMLEIEKNADKLGLEQGSILYFALFAAYENIGDYKTAFAHLEKGNALKRKLIPYEAQKQKNAFMTIREAYSAKKMKNFAGKGYKTDLPVFIVGMPRSGTTLTEQIISSHPDVFGAGELMEISMLDMEFTQMKPENAAAQGKWYVDRVRPRDPTGKALRITDKMPGNFSSLGKIFSVLPDAKVIHTRRHPVDTCLSCFKQNFARGQYWSYNLAELGAYYNDYLDLMAYWREVYPGRFIEIDYEETVDKFEDQARMLINYVGLPWDDACLEPHKQKRTVLTASKMQVIKPVYKTSVKSWERYGDQLQPLIDSLSKGPAKDLL